MKHDPAMISEFCDLLKAVCIAQDVPPGLVLAGAQRKPDVIVAARDELIRRCKDRWPELSYPKLGELIGLSHAAVIHAHRRARARCEAVE